MIDEATVEAQIQEKGLTAPRVKPEDLDAEMNAAEVQYFLFPGTTVTVCCVVLKNGYSVVGTAAAASPENFNAEVGRNVSWKDARSKLWGLLGFRLRDQLSEV